MKWQRIHNNPLKFRELQENKDRKLNKIWKIAYWQNEKFDKEAEIEKQILEIKNAVNWIFSIKKLQQQGYSRRRKNQWTWR